MLTAAAQYFFKIDAGKKVRPVMVLLMGKAMSAHDDAHAKAEAGGAAAADDRAEVSADAAGAGGARFTLQRRLAEITEMIHTASLFHDDVIDKVRAAPLCRIATRTRTTAPTPTPAASLSLLPRPTPGAASRR